MDIFCRHLELQYKISARYYEVDLTKENAPVELTNWVKKHFPVNILVNNAGLGGGKPFEESSFEYIDAIIMLNLRALVLITRQMLSDINL